MWQSRKREFFIGLISGGIATGTVAGTLALLISDIPRQFRLGTALLLISAIAVMAIIGKTTSLPQNRRQIPQTVTHTGDPQGALQFGFELGCMMRTYISSCYPHILIVLVVLLGENVLNGIVAGTGIALGRASTALNRLGYSTTETWQIAMARNRKLVGAVHLMCVGASGAAIIYPGPILF